MSNDSADETERLLRFLYACPVGLIETGCDGAISLMNPMAMQLLLPLAGGKPFSNLFQILGHCAPELRNMMQAFAAGHGSVCSGHRVHAGHLSGPRSDKPYVLACTIVKLDADQFMASIEDVSEHVAQERRLKEAEAWFASLLDSPDGFALVGLDASGHIEAVNASAQQQTGFAEADLVGRHAAVLDSLDAGSGALMMDEAIELARRDGWHLSDGWCAQRNGGRFRCQRLVSVCREGESKGRQRVMGYTVILRPAAKGRIDAHEIRRRLTMDDLTGAYNRAHFFEIADHERQRCLGKRLPLGLLLLDLDHFKRVNDTHGHGIGDRVLEEVAKACRAALRPSDSLARLGGEEFVALLPGADDEIVADIGERLRAATASTLIRAGGTDLAVTASIGGISDLTAQLSLRSLLDAADRALYAAKRNGRNRVVLHQDQRFVA